MSVADNYKHAHKIARKLTKKAESAARRSNNNQSKRAFRKAWDARDKALIAQRAARSWGYMPWPEAVAKAKEYFGIK